MTLRRFIAELICQAEEEGLMDLHVTNLYFPGQSESLGNGKSMLPIMIEVAENPNNSDTEYGAKAIKRDW